MVPKEKATAIYVLQPADEFREPYELALVPFSEKVVWFSDYINLLEEIGREAPNILVVDLDCLDTPSEFQLQELKSELPQGDVIAISSTDSAQMALHTIRTGCSDFLLKPVSPEELAWSIRKSQQRQQVLQKVVPADPQGSLLKAITQIASFNSGALVQAYSLEYLRALGQAFGAAWLKLDLDGKTSAEVLCCIPKKMENERVLQQIPFKKLTPTLSAPIVIRSKTPEKQKIIFPCRDYPKEAVMLWNIKVPLTPSLVTSMNTVVEHADLTLLNISKYDELKAQTFIDDLTGLYNARFLKYAVTNAILKCKTPGQCFSILFIDVDHFKSVNDINGHLVGSEFLVAIGKTINHAVRSADQVFRYGGDEYVVILHATGTDGAKEIAERIRKNIERRVFHIQTKKLRTTVSIGIATYPEHAAEKETLLRLADEAMYSAKKKTRNAVHLALGIERSDLENPADPQKATRKLITE